MHCKCWLFCIENGIDFEPTWGLLPPIAASTCQIHQFRYKAVRERRSKNAWKTLQKRVKNAPAPPAVVFFTVLSGCSGGGWPSHLCTAATDCEQISRTCRRLIGQDWRVQKKLHRDLLGRGSDAAHGPSLQADAIWKLWKRYVTTKVVLEIVSPCPCTTACGDCANLHNIAPVSHYPSYDGSLNWMFRVISQSRLRFKLLFIFKIPRICPDLIIWIPQIENNRPFFNQKIIIFRGNSPLSMHFQ